MKSKLSPLMVFSIQWTLIFCTAAAALVLLLLPENKLNAVLALFYGAGMGLTGLYLIHLQSLSLTSMAEREKRKGFVNYTLRYALYALLLVCAVYMNLPLLGVLAGVMLQKASLLFYAVKNRKDSI